MSPTAWSERLASLVNESRRELSRWHRSASFSRDLFRYGTRQLRQDKANQMAAALAFRTLFGLIPVLVVGTVLVRAFRGTDQFFEALEEGLIAVGLDKVAVSVEGAERVSGSQFLMNLASEAQNINLTAIGWVGLAVLIYSAVGLMATIENSFNTIYRAPAGRSWTRRLPIYWTVLTLAPLAIGLTVFMNAKFTSLVETVSTWQWILAVAPLVWNFVVLWLLIMLLYKLVPNTTVSLSAVLAGSFVTAILVEIGRRSLGAYFANAVSLRHLYGSLGFVPLFMFWVYLMWVVVLFGLEVSAILQSLGGRSPREIENRQEPTGLVDPASVVLLMEVVVDRFQSGQPSTARGLAEATGIPEATVHTMIDHLIARGFLHPLEHDEKVVTLARPPEQIAAGDIIEVGMELVQVGGGMSSELVQRLRAAQKSLASGVKLGSLTAS